MSVKLWWYRQRRRLGFVFELLVWLALGAGALFLGVVLLFGGRAFGQVPPDGLSSQGYRVDPAEAGEVDYWWPWGRTRLVCTYYQPIRWKSGGGWEAHGSLLIGDDARNAAPVLRFVLLPQGRAASAGVRVVYFYVDGMPSTVPGFFFGGSSSKSFTFNNGYQGSILGWSVWPFTALGSSHTNGGLGVFPAGGGFEVYADGSTWSGDMLVNFDPEILHLRYVAEEDPWLMFSGGGDMTAVVDAIEAFNQDFEDWVAGSGGWFAFYNGWAEWLTGEQGWFGFNLRYQADMAAIRAAIGAGDDDPESILMVMQQIRDELIRTPEPGDIPEPLEPGSPGGGAAGWIGGSFQPEIDHSFGPLDFSYVNPGNTMPSYTWTIPSFTVGSFASPAMVFNWSPTFYGLFRAYIWVLCTFVIITWSMSRVWVALERS